MMNILQIPKDFLLQCMLYFTLSEIIVFANTCKYLKKISKKVPVKELNIKIYQDDLDWILSYVGRFPLNKLTLSGTAFSDYGLTFIKTPLKILNLDASFYTTDKVLYSVDCSVLEEVHLSDCDITIDALSQLNEAIIHTLSFVGCVLEEGVLRFLQNFKHLRCLNLSCTDVTDDDIKLINDNLRILYLQGTQVTDNAVVHISKFPLRYLDVHNSFITLNGEEKLRKSIPKCKFRFSVRYR